ncbi:MAG: DUF2961 domain-containing protein [Clostridia bacterium]|nr:DUF2961 domain-containing protein [Clostridia bacterium]
MISGLSNSLETIYMLSNAKTRSLSAENKTGEKGKGGMEIVENAYNDGSRELGQGWKVSPALHMEGNSVTEIANIEGPGAIQHIWMTIGKCKGRDNWKDFILRIYWDDQEWPSVEVPAGDFFCNGWNEYAHVNSLAVCANPARGFNCYWTMPFKKRCRITIENRNPITLSLFYQIDYALAPVEDDCAYFCASYRRSNPTVDGIHTVIDGIEGKGHYVGTYMAWQVNNNGWWGEGEIKFFMDGDKEFPTICGTGTEDYFCGAYNFDVVGQGYTTFSTAYSGMPQVIRPDGLYIANTRFGMYRWHITDPIRFEKDLRVTIQDLGWRGIKGVDKRFLKQQSDIASVAYWYQTLPTKPFPTLGDRDELEVI